MSEPRILTSPPATDGGKPESAPEKARPRMARGRPAKADALPDAEGDAREDDLSDEEERELLRELEELERRKEKLTWLQRRALKELRELEDEEEDGDEGDLAPAEPGAPWNPWTCVAWAMLFGLPVSGSLLAMNFRRLGRPSLRLPMFLFSMAGTALLLWWGVARIDDFPKREMHYIFRGASVVLSLPAWWLQQDAFKTYEQQKKRTANTIIPAILTAAVTWGGIFGFLALLD